MFELPKVFVKPAPGVKVPLPVEPGLHIPDAGKLVPRTAHVELLITSGDLIECGADGSPLKPLGVEADAASAEPAPADAAAADAKKKG